MSKIEDGLAVSIAGQISAGLTPGDDQDDRAKAALVAIGFMLLNANDNPLILETLEMIEKTTFTKIDGGWEIVMQK